jgi:hypothetical protein
MNRTGIILSVQENDDESSFQTARPNNCQSHSLLRIVFRRLYHQATAKCYKLLRGISAALTTSQCAVMKDLYTSPFLNCISHRCNVRYHQFPAHSSSRHHSGEGQLSCRFSLHNILLFSRQRYIILSLVQIFCWSSGVRSVLKRGGGVSCEVWPVSHL